MAKNLFIVIEGLDATGKSTLVSNLAAALNAKLLSCPPCIEASELVDGDLREHFDKRPPSVRRAYYRATNLIASELAVSTLTDQHVVMDRYWTSTVSFSAMDDGNQISQWEGKYPLAIRPPDVLILLTVDENNRNKRMVGRGEPTTDEEYNLASDTKRRESVIAAYRSFSPIEIDTSNLNPEEVLQAALRIVENHSHQVL
jgi:thymidylate kinase